MSRSLVYNICYLGQFLEFFYSVVCVESVSEWHSSFISESKCINYFLLHPTLKGLPMTTWLHCQIHI